MANLGVAQVIGRKGLIRYIDIHDVAKEIRRVGAGYGQHGIGGRHIPQPDIFCVPYMAPKMIMVSPRMRDPAHHHEAVIAMPRDRHVAFDTALFVQHQAIGHPADRHGHIVGAESLQKWLRIRPLDHEFAKHRIVEQRHVFAGGLLLHLRIFEPAWAMERASARSLCRRQGWRSV